jgi:three-Cys-motif partner protein
MNPDFLLLVRQNQVMMSDAPVDDGLYTRSAGEWTLDKLEIIRRYTIEFAKICDRHAPSFHFIDGFAGPGVNRLRNTSELYWGSPMIALRTKPPFSRCLLLEYTKRGYEALSARTSSFGERASVHRGDSNSRLIPLMQNEINHRAPSLCVLDPEGSELEWPTVVGVAEFKRGQKHKVEQLILLATDTGFTRGLFTRAQIPDSSIAMMDRIFGNQRWHSIYERRLNGDITPKLAREEYVKLFQYGLERELGYAHTLVRPIKDRGFEGRLKYMLVFATSNATGARIMGWVFDRVVAERPPSRKPEPLLPPPDLQTRFDL